MWVGVSYGEESSRWPQWVQVVIVEWCGPLSYLVQTLNGKVWKHHIYHVKIGNEGSAVEVKNHGQDDVTKRLLWLFQRSQETWQKLHWMLHLKAPVNPQHHKEFVDCQEHVDPLIDWIFKGGGVYCIGRCYIYYFNYVVYTCTVHTKRFLWLSHVCWDSCGNHCSSATGTSQYSSTQL